MGGDPRFRAALAARLKAARESAGLSQGQVAVKLGVQRPTISEMEAGHRKVSAEELPQLAELYGVGISWLMREEPEVGDLGFELAARELAKMKTKDFDSVIKLLETLRKTRASKS